MILSLCLPVSEEQIGILLAHKGKINLGLLIVGLSLLSYWNTILLNVYGKYWKIALISKYIYQIWVILSCVCVCVYIYVSLRMHWKMKLLKIDILGISSHSLKMHPFSFLHQKSGPEPWVPFLKSSINIE